MPITPLPQFETDLAEHLAEQADREAYERLNAPKTIVVRFGHLMMVGEFAWLSDAKPGCGSKVVLRTSRGTEIGEMLTSTCANSGCSKSVTRKEMLEYIENSGGRQYPFYTDGKALRIATKEDLDAQAALEGSRPTLVKEARVVAARLGLDMKIVQAEPILGGERLTIYYTAEDRVDFRALVQELRKTHHDRIDMRQVGSRDEARLTADYERCGQYCCCKNFLKVLKPISMRSAKIQKATLDPLKISGRCGRLMCCLRYEDQTYDELRKNLPHRKTLVGTPEGDGIVIDSQILTQLVLVELDETRKRVSIPVEDLTKPGERRSKEPAPETHEGGQRTDASETRSGGEKTAPGKKKRRRRRKKSGAAGTPAPTDQGTTPTSDAKPRTESAEQHSGPKKKRRRRRKPSSARGGPSSAVPGSETAAPSASAGPHSESPGSGGSAAGPQGSKKKRRRRRRKPSGGGSGGESGNGPSPTSD